jgi:hypothetical protein
MFGRRIVILVAVLMGLTALAASVAPPPDPARRDRAPTPTPSPSPSPAAPAGEVDARIVIGPPGGALSRVRARVGDTVMLEVSGDVVDSVVVGNLPVIEPIDPDTPARLQLLPDTPGSYPVRLVDQGRDVGVLEVGPSG